MTSVFCDTALSLFMFSLSDEYETALISERRAQGRYDQRRSPWPMVMFVGCALLVVGSVLLFN